MFAYEPPLNPPCDEWLDCKLPLLCEERMKEICQDILSKGERTSYQKIYAAMYEMVEEDIEDDRIEEEISAYA
jgi:hypothetical protein